MKSIYIIYNSFNFGQNLLIAWEYYYYDYFIIIIISLLLLFILLSLIEVLLGRDLFVIDLIIFLPGVFIWMLLLSCLVSFIYY